MTEDSGLARPQTPQPAARVICARCHVGEITYGSGVCPLCGYSPATGEVIEDPLPKAIDEAVRRELGEQLKIDRLLGRGGMSLVYLAREIELNRLIAVKVLPLQLSLEQDAVDRFKREAKIGASLDHPHIVPVHRVGTTPTLLWYSMKWVKGGSLRDLLDKAGPMSLADFLKIIEPVASALHYAHRRGIVHRDIKPANILIDDTGWVGICDFGIAKAFGAAPVTKTGATVGTPGYMAPEQCYGKSLDGRADQYSLAILTYECLAGQVPFTGDSMGEMVRKHCMEPPPRISSVRPDLPSEVSAALLVALSKRPEDRFQTVVEFVRALGGDPSRGGTLAVPMPEDSSLASLPTQPLAKTPPKIPARAKALTWLPPLMLGLVVAGVVLLSREAGTPVPRAPASAPALPATAREPGYLTVNSRPWGELFIDGQRVGQTPVKDHALNPGRHHVQVVKQGYRPFEQDIEIAAGDHPRLTQIVLKKVPPP